MHSEYILIMFLLVPYKKEMFFGAFVPVLVNLDLTVAKTCDISHLTKSGWPKLQETGMFVKYNI